MIGHYHFGDTSRQRLATCVPELRDVMEMALRFGVLDITILEGYRGEDAQMRAYTAGRSKLQWPDGKHNRLPSRAVDIAPFPIDWQDRERFVFLAGLVKAAAVLCGVEIRWGGDWSMDGRMSDETFRDLGHFEVLLPIEGGE